MEKGFSNNELPFIQLYVPPTLSAAPGPINTYILLTPASTCCLADWSQSHFYCEEIGKSLERVLQKGGKVIIPETKIDAEGRGHFAVFADSEGNHIGLYSDK